MIPKIELGVLTLYGYGSMIGLGIVLTYWVIRWEARRKGLTGLVRRLEVLTVCIILAAIAGGKLAFVAFRGSPRSASTLGLLSGQGFVFYGSLLACLAVTWLYLRLTGLPVLRSLDAIAVGIPVMHLMGRLGCFLAGCCYGRGTDGLLATTFVEGYGLNGVPVHPVQLYEAIGNGFIFAFLWFGARHSARAPGQVLATYGLLYSTLRFATEFFRGDSRPVLLGCDSASWSPDAAICGLTLGQGVSILLFAGAVLALLTMTRKESVGIAAEVH